MNRPTEEQQQQEHHPQRVQSDERRARRTERGRTEAGEHEPPRRIEIAKLREVGRNLGSQLGEQTRKRPYVVVGAAAALGFVAGSILGSRLGQVILAVGVGYAAKNVLGGDFGVDRLEEGLGKLAQERAKG